MNILTYTGRELDACVAIALGLNVRPTMWPPAPIAGRVPKLCYVLFDPGLPTTLFNSKRVPPYSTDIATAWPLIKEHHICIDAGDGLFPQGRMWAAWPAENIPFGADEEVTDADPLVAAMRALAIHKLGRDYVLPTLPEAV